MLDSENDGVTGAASAPEATAPPARRRSSRAAAETTDGTEAPPRRTSRRRTATTAEADVNAGTDAGDTSEAPPRRTSRRAKVAAPPADDTLPPAPDTAVEAAGPTTRRRSRRAAEPAPDQVGDGQAAPNQSPADQPSADRAETTDEAPATPRRTRRSTSSARREKSAEGSAADSSNDTADSSTVTADSPVAADASAPHDTPSEAGSADSAGAAPAESRHRRSRRRSTEQDAPESDSAQTAAEGHTAEIDQASTQSPDRPAGESAPPAEERSGNRRRRNRGASPVDDEPPLELPWPTGDADPIAAALSELSQNRRQGTSKRHAPQSESLDELASAIATDSDSDRTTVTGEAVDTDDSDDGAGDGRRRRRRRGGRRHRKGSDSDNDESTANGTKADSAAEVTDDTADDDSDQDVRRRRRRRRRRGEDAVESEDDPRDVVDRVREPRSQSGDSEVTGIVGSTRLEAKRQRRREGRAASRRRVPILSEAEFLARRESVARTMLIRQSEDYSQIAVLEDGILVEHYVDRAEATSLIGNVYLGRVQNVLPSMEAVFFDIGRGRNAVLFAGEVDWDSFGSDSQNRRVEEVFTSGQSVLVQVTKDPIGAKGARLTSHISIPGRFVVYAPGGHLSGISRKLADTERNRLKGILEDLVGGDASVIVRTAAEGAATDELVHDVNRLKAQWEVIERKAGKSSAPQLLYSEPDLTMRIVRDLFTEDFSELVIDGNGELTDAYETVQAYLQHVAPNLADRTQRWDRGQGDLFARYRIDEQIAKALDRKVHLPSGGTLIIDRTEAMTVIDVNTGKFTGSGGTLEATVTSNNLEAAEEVVRQLRLRDIGGIIVIDFIDMVLPANRELLLRRLVECLSRDRTRHQVSEVTSLGLVQMTRKRVGTGLAEAFTRTCEQCGGLGYHRLTDPIDDPSHPDGGERSHRRGRNNS